jgi:CHAD domain-containing protein
LNPKSKVFPIFKTLKIVIQQVNMSTKEAVKQYFEKYLKELRLQLKTAIDTQEENAVHQFRVNTKKLNALIQYLEKKYPEEKYRKDFQPIKKIFKKAGKIREIQLDIQKLNNLSGELKDIKNQLNKAFEFSIEDFLKLEGHWKKDLSFFSNSMKGKLKNITFEELQLYFSNLIKGAHSQLLNRSYHNARKNIKSILYLRELIPLQQQEDLAIDFVFLEKLQEKIGIWHDLVTSIDLGNNLVFIPNKEEEIHSLESEFKSIAPDFLKIAYLKNSSQ